MERDSHVQFRKGIPKGLYNHKLLVYILGLKDGFLPCCPACSSTSAFCFKADPTAIHHYVSPSSNSSAIDKAEVCIQERSGIDALLHAGHAVMTKRRRPIAPVQSWPVILTAKPQIDDSNPPSCLPAHPYFHLALLVSKAKVGLSSSRNRWRRPPGVPTSRGICRSCGGSLPRRKP